MTPAKQVHFAFNLFNLYWKLLQFCVLGQHLHTFSALQNSSKFNCMSCTHAIMYPWYNFLESTPPCTTLSHMGRINFEQYYTVHQKWLCKFLGKPDIPRLEIPFKIGSCDQKFIHMMLGPRWGPCSKKSYKLLTQFSTVNCGCYAR